MDESQRKANDSRDHPLSPVWSGLIFVAFLLLYWILSSTVLWWSYDITPLIRGGYYQVNRAVTLVGEMGLIISALTSVAWALVRRRTMASSGWRLAWNISWRTWVLMFAYAGAVLARLELGHGNVPLDDSAFLPVLGHVNSHFFSESNWLIFLLYVIPLVGCISGALYWLQDRLVRGTDAVSR